MKIKTVAQGWPPLRVPSPVPPPIRIQCEAIIPLPDISHLKSWRRNRYGLKPECCQRLALYNMDGVNYCAIHAGRVALRFLYERSLKEGDV